ncbi:hypothetical protein [Pelomonas cellulosilytica]|uniref:Uncharacterized protein n=1 Tax=Pelomonas cellulosilytica TaxID=2906762 RepID=A0ABS8XTT5_9BURK|nr:hypothetical protein [Pelomonas sp. P8]MCE4555278.1 hypothetical protein [Pelomonas sp. P8]
MIRSLATAAVMTAALAAAPGAQAGTHWSIGVGINLPPADIVVTNAPRYVAPAPVYYEPPPVVYVPAPRYVQREVYYAPPPPPRVVYETSYRQWDRHHWDDRRWDDRRWEHERRERHEHWDGEGPRRGR